MSDFSRIAIAQFNPKVGDVPGNLKKIIAYADEAKKAGAELVLFPELALVGYPPRDLLDYPALAQENLQALAEVKKHSFGVTLVCGFVEPNPAPEGKPFFNSVAVLRDGRELLRYRKQLLPTYDIFEDERYFEPGKTAGIFEWEGKRFGILICEDLWNQPGFLERYYANSPVQGLKNEKIDCLLVPSASPFQLGKPRQREALLKKTFQTLGVPIFYCNQVGGNDELLFDGGSLAVDAQGGVSARGPVFEESLISVKQDSSWPVKEEEWLRRALCFGLKDYLQKCGAQGICLGLSGGIDSSVVAVIAAQALGPGQVEGVSLPSRFTSEASREDAKLLAQNLGIAFREFPIEPVFEAVQTLLGPIHPTGLTLENIQPRLRMTVLMAVANEGKKLLVNTSNKSEIATGFATLYGDSSGALSVIGDLTKRQVYALARHLNQPKVTIPLRVLERPPTAELREDQTDQDTLPAYDTLDKIVELVFGDKADPQTLRKRGVDAPSVEIFCRLHTASEFKRRQLPPVLRVSPKAFGMGRRIPVASRKYTER